MTIFRRGSLFKTIGSLAGAVIGGVVLGGIGVRALDNSPGFLSGIAFFVSFIGMLFGFVAPLALG